ncbi:MAG: GIY-YIG nuclease family protein [Arenimonas sp.]
MKHPAVHIMASQRNGTLYIGVTSDLIKRVSEHKQSLVSSFVSHYRVMNLVYYEQAEDRLAAIARERQLKKWNREWKIRLIEEMNPYWNDLYNSIL